MVKPPANDRDVQWNVWAAAAQRGDKAAYALLLKDIMPYIRALILPTLANPDWADDVVQEVLISVHKSLKTYDPALSFRPWLGAVIRFRRADFLRRHYSARGDKRTSLDDPAFQRQHVTDTPLAGEWKDMEAALARLPKKQRKVLELMKIQGLTAQEVANETGMSVSAVKVSVHRSMNKLKDMMEQG